MSASQSPGISREPTFLAFLPVLCAVWADGLMEEEELDAVSRAITDAEWMTAEGRARVRDWLDPASPPTPAVFGEATATIRSAAVNGTLTLTRAGLAVAEAGSPGTPQEAVPWRDDALATLGRVELDLGLAGAEALRYITGSGERAAVVAEPTPSVTAEIAALIRGDHPVLRARVRAVLNRPELRIPDEISRGEYRERTLAAVHVLARAGLGAVAYPREYGGEGDPCGAVAVFGELALGDLSVLVKYGVQFGLFGGSIAQLGTERHHRRYLSRIASLELPGCYAMTETGHGSNVRDLRTMATYDPRAREFVITTPDDDARKDYIGNAALHGRMATVFARLLVPVRGDGPAADHGVHAFLVPIRDDSGATRPGVRIEDCGAKEGLNGVDNGRIRFDRVRIPHDALLDRFAQVTHDGEYHSPIPSAGRRFFTMLGTLIAGRISIAAASQAVTRKALTIALRYTATRRQFGPAGAPEVPVLDYLSLQRDLLPRLATTYALGFAVQNLVRRYADPETDRRELEVRAAALKAAASRHALDTLQACREAVRRTGVPGREPVRPPEGRHRRLRHLRRRQPRAAAAGRQGSAVALPQGHGRPVHVGHGPLPRRIGRDPACRHEPGRHPPDRCRAPVRPRVPAVGVPVPRAAAPALGGPPAEGAPGPGHGQLCGRERLPGPYDHAGAGACGPDRAGGRVRGARRIGGRRREGPCRGRPGPLRARHAREAPRLVPGSGLLRTRQERGDQARGQPPLPRTGAACAGTGGRFRDSGRADPGADRGEGLTIPPI